MRKIIYYVASSLDGYIMGEDENMGSFVGEGSGISQYMSDLQNFDTVIMGRKTYEFGYRFGLVEGKKAYPHMNHYIFSNNLKLNNAEEGINVCEIDLSVILMLKKQDGTDIYLCGGGEFAGWLLDNKQIDVLKIKLNPVILGKGVRLFGKSKCAYKASLIGSKTYENGLQIMDFNLEY
ncbi:MAG: dihydrofolate reductase [Saprospiraceae bacterium]|nr:dihydrofolate reductase [Saprospiraceae bacterium]